MYEQHCPITNNSIVDVGPLSGEKNEWILFLKRPAFIIHVFPTFTIIVLF